MPTDQPTRRCETPTTRGTTCGKPIADTLAKACEQCIAEATGLPWRIASYADDLEQAYHANAGLRSPALGNTSPTSRDPGTFPGADQLAAIGPASTEDGHTTEFHTDADPPNIREWLTRTLDAWADEGAPMPRTPGIGTTRDLATRTTGLVRWAARNSTWWNDWIEEARDVERRIKTLVAALPNDVIVGPCITITADGTTCQGRIIRHWTDKGLDDDATCATCHHTYDTPAIARAQRQRLQDHALTTNPHALVTPAEAAICLGLERNTVNKAVSRARSSGTLPTPTRERFDGTPMWDLATIADLTRTCQPGGDTPTHQPNNPARLTTARQPA